MSYNDTLDANNDILQTILDTINSLPEAGGTVIPNQETWTLMLKDGSTVTKVVPLL